MCSSDLNLIRNLIKLHNILVEVIFCIEQYFGFSIITFIILHFFNIVIYCYYLLEIWFRTEHYFQSWNDYGLIIIIVSQILFANVRFAGFIEICNKTVQQNQKICMNIRKFLNLNIAPEMREYLNIFSSQLESRKVEFSAAGILKLDRSFYLMVSWKCV